MGIPATFTIGEPLRFTVPWQGEATSGSIWIYPGPTYAGTFTVVDGAVTVTLDTSVVSAEGETFFTFFGDNGTTITVSSIADGFLAQSIADSDDGTQQDADQPLPTVEIAAAPAQDYGVLIGVIIGLGVLAVGAVVATILVVRRRAAA